jgi:hypothetical protein
LDFHSGNRHTQIKAWRPLLQAATKWLGEHQRFAGDARRKRFRGQYKMIASCLGIVISAVATRIPQSRFCHGHPGHGRVMFL